MSYQFAVHDEDYTDLSGGRVLYSQPGQPAFPIRLAVEIFMRAREYLTQPQRLTLYDPTCGGAYHLAALGLLFGAQIDGIIVSDVDEAALALARRNLGLLSSAGLDRREAEIRSMLAQFGKGSHQAALASLARLRARVDSQPPIWVEAFQANALRPEEILSGLAGKPVHLVIADIPYGSLSGWSLPPGESPASPVARLLEALRQSLPLETLVVVAADKGQKIAHPAYRRLQRFQIGKRQVALLRQQEASAA